MAQRRDRQFVHESATRAGYEMATGENVACDEVLSRVPFSKPRGPALLCRMVVQN